MSLYTWLNSSGYDGSFQTEAEKKREAHKQAKAAEDAKVSADAKYIVNKLLLWLVGVPVLIGLVIVLIYVLQ